MLLERKRTQFRGRKVTADKEGWILRKLQSFTSRQFIGWRQQSSNKVTPSLSKHSDAGINVIIFTSWQLIAALGEFREYTAEFLETGGNGTESVHYVRLFREFLTTLCFAWRWRGRYLELESIVTRQPTTHRPYSDIITLLLLLRACGCRLLPSPLQRFSWCIFCPLRTAFQA